MFIVIINNYLVVDQECHSVDCFQYSHHLPVCLVRRKLLLITERNLFLFCRAVPKRLKDKLVSYILVLVLMIDEFLLDCTVIMKDLKMSPSRYVKVGC